MPDDVEQLEHGEYSAMVDFMIDVSRRARRRG
jgi:hypothetical protein